MSVVFSNCVECRHFLYNEKTREYTCKAFPKGIPGQHMFRKDQNETDECAKDIRFEKEEG